MILNNSTSAINRGRNVTFKTATSKIPIRYAPPTKATPVNLQMT